MEAIYLYKVVAHLLSPQQQKHTHTQVTDGRVRPVAPVGGGESGLPSPEQARGPQEQEVQANTVSCARWKQISSEISYRPSCGSPGYNQTQEGTAALHIGLHWIFFPLLGFMWFLFPSVRISLCLTPWGPWRTEPWLRQGLLWSPPSGRHWI